MNKDVDDEANFLEQMQDVKPLAQDKIPRAHRNSSDGFNNQYRRKVATKSLSKYKNFLTDGEVEIVEPNEILSFKISGIQPQVFKNLRNAKYKFDYHLDLHRFTVNEARETIYKLISSAEIEDFRCFLITHGKGERSAQPARLKSYLNHWLQQIEQVVAFHSALPQHGGSGSVYVLLKKTKHKRSINQAKYN